MLATHVKEENNAWKGGKEIVKLEPRMLDRVVRKGLSEKVTMEERPERR